MKQKIKMLLTKHKSLILYLFFGVCSTLINMITYYGAYKLLQRLLTERTAILSANIISWVITILFVYFTNRQAVFDSSASTTKTKFLEFGRFTASRLFTLLLESATLLVGNTLSLDTLLVKLAAQFIVIASNFVISKFFVFR